MLSSRFLTRDIFEQLSIDYEDFEAENIQETVEIEELLGQEVLHLKDTPLPSILNATVFNPRKPIPIINDLHIKFTEKDDILQLKITDFLKMLPAHNMPQLEITNDQNAMPIISVLSTLGINVNIWGFLLDYEENEPEPPFQLSCTYPDCLECFHTLDEYHIHYIQHDNEFMLQPIWNDTLRYMEVYNDIPTFEDLLNKVPKIQINAGQIPHYFISPEIYAQAVSDRETWSHVQILDSHIAIDLLRSDFYNAARRLGIPISDFQSLVPIISETRFHPIIENEAEREIIRRTLCFETCEDIYLDEPDMIPEEDISDMEVYMTKDEFMEDIIETIKALDTKDLSTWKSKIDFWNRVTLSDANTINIDEDTPIILATKIECGKLPTIGFVCPFGECLAKETQQAYTNASGLRAHIKARHPRYDRLTMGGQHEFAYLSNIAERCVGIRVFNDTIEEEMKPKNISVCLFHNCNFVGTPTNLAAHQDRLHNNCRTLMKTLGPFWVYNRNAIIYHETVIRIKDWTRTRDITFCPHEDCNAVFPSVHSLNQHYTAMHLHGERLPAHVAVDNIIGKIKVDSIEDLEEARYNRQPENSGNEQTPPSRTERIISAQVERQRAQVIRREESLSIENEKTENYRNLSPERRTKKATKWYKKYNSEEKDRLSFPKFDRKRRKLINEGLKERYEQEWIPLLDAFLQDDVVDPQTVIDGLILKLNHLMRKHISKALNINATASQNISNNKKRLKAKRRLANIENSIVKTETLLKRIMKTRKIFKNGTLTVTEENFANSVFQDILELCNEKGDEWAVQIFGGNTWEKLNEFFNDTEEHFEEKINWIRDKLHAELAMLKRSPKESARLREAYFDDPKKTLEHSIWKKETPGTKLKGEDFKEYYGPGWSDNVSNYQTADPDSPWYASKVLTDSDNLLIEETIYNQFIIEEIIESRNHRSSLGNDAIGYSIYKLCKKQAADYLSKLFKFIVKFRVIPSSWKNSKTVMLYKKGDPEQPQNWRPIGITPCTYRIFACAFAKGIQKVNNIHPLVNINQKGFVESVNGITDNTCLINELLAAAQRRGGSNAFLSIDFKNAFGSIPHQLIFDVLKQKGFNDTLVNIVKNIYKDQSTHIDLNGSRSNRIYWNKGVIQGCPLSPLLFNLALDPMLDAICRDNPDDAMIITTDAHSSCKFQVAAYADDVILMATTKNQMTRLITTVERFTEFSKLTIEPNKCCLIAKFNGWTRGDISINGQPIAMKSTSEDIKYLGAAMSGTRKRKIKDSRRIIEDIKTKTQKIFASDLSFSQKMHALRTFVIPILDHTLLHGTVSLHDMDKLDQFIRGCFNKELGVFGIPTNFFNLSAKKGGLGIPNFRDRSSTLSLTTLIRLLTSKDKRIGKFIGEMINEERLSRNIHVDRNSTFQDWKLDEYGRPIQQHEEIHSHSIAIKAAKATHDLGIKTKLKFSLSGKFIKATMQGILEGDPTNDPVDLTGPRDVKPALRDILDNRYMNQLSKAPLHGHAWPCCGEDEQSNKLYSSSKLVYGQELSKFAIKARLNILGTGEIISKRNPNNESVKYCKICKDKLDSLAHRLNGCPHASNLYTYRHNLLDSTFTKYTKSTFRDAIVFRNCSVCTAIPDVQVSDSNARLRPDQIILTEDNIFIIDFSVPYGDNKEENHPLITPNTEDENLPLSSSLNRVFRDKFVKYKSLRDEIQQNEEREVILLPIIVSSVGVIPACTSRAIEVMFTNKRTRKSLKRDLSRDAIVGSWVTFYRKPPKLIGDRRPCPITEPTGNQSAEDSASHLSEIAQAVSEVNSRTI